MLVLHDTGSALACVLEARLSSVVPVDLDLAVIGAGPVRQGRLDESTPAHWRGDLTRLGDALEVAENITRNARERRRRAHVVFIVHPTGHLARSNSIRSAVSEAVLRGFAETAECSTVDGGARIDVIVSRHGGWEKLPTDTDGAMGDQIAKAVTFLVTKQFTRNRTAVLDISDGEWIVTSGTSASPLLGLFGIGEDE